MSSTKPPSTAIYGLADEQLDHILTAALLTSRTILETSEDLCDCGGPSTKPQMQHYCDCTAVKAAAALVGIEETAHYKECPYVSLQHPSIEVVDAPV